MISGPIQRDNRFEQDQVEVMNFLRSHLERQMDELDGDETDSNYGDENFQQDFAEFEWSDDWNTLGWDADTVKVIKKPLNGIVNIIFFTCFSGLL